MQIDDLLTKYDDTTAEMERLREEKDQEILILQEGVDDTLQQLHEAQQVCVSSWNTWTFMTNAPKKNQGIVDETTNAHIDTLILDHRKKLNEIIGIVQYFIRGTPTKL